MERVCNRDCFNCPFPDCVLETLEAEDYRMQREAAELLKTSEQKKIAAKQRAYREANRDEITAKQGRLLYDFRHEHGMTQTALGKFLGGLSQPIISLYETGAVPIPDHILEACGLASVQAVSS